MNETIFEKEGQVNQLKSSPLLLMKEGRIPRVFDMICSGDGEEILYQIGNALNQSIENNKNLDNVYQYDGLKKAKGDWVLGWLNKKNECSFIQSEKERSIEKVKYI